MRCIRAMLCSVILFGNILPAAGWDIPRDVPGVVILGERKIPAPAGLSSEMLEVVKRRQIPPTLPAPKSTEAWLKFIAKFNVPGAELGRAAAKKFGVTYEVKEIAGVRTYWVTPKKVNDRCKDRVFVHTHGGAWAFGGGDSALREAVWVSWGLGVNVISIDYRKPPLHPYPAAIDDAVGVWTEVIKSYDPSSIAWFGTSAGGNLTLGTTLKLKELGLPLPGALFAGTPATDLENISDTWYTLEGLDPLGGRVGMVGAAFDLYVGDADASIPFLSPVNGDLKGFPPTILISGTRDMLLSDTVRMHRALRKAGVVADLHVYDGQVHGDYMQNLLGPVPENADAQREIFEFFDRHLK